MNSTTWFLYAREMQSNILKNNFFFSCISNDSLRYASPHKSFVGISWVLSSSQLWIAELPQTQGTLPSPVCTTPFLRILPDSVICCSTAELHMNSQISAFLLFFKFIRIQMPSPILTLPVISYKQFSTHALHFPPTNNNKLHCIHWHLLSATGFLRDKSCSQLLLYRMLELCSICLMYYLPPLPTSLSIKPWWQPEPQKETSKNSELSLMEDGGRGWLQRKELRWPPCSVSIKKAFPDQWPELLIQLESKANVTPRSCQWQRREKRRYGYISPSWNGNFK